MTRLRPYQVAAYDAVRASLAKHRAVLLVLPTAAGKTVFFAEVVNRVSQAGGTVLVAAHRRELINQASAKLRDAGVRHGIIMPGVTPAASSVQVGSIQTLGRRLDRLPRFDLIIADEAHHTVAGQWKALLDSQPQARLLGVTATPVRLDGRGLGDVFADLIVGPTISEMIEDGYLSAYRVFAPAAAPDVRALHVLAGDFNPRELTTTMDKPHLTGDAISHYGRYCAGAPAITFCTSVQHAEHVAEEFRNEGWSWVCLHGGMSTAEREDGLAALASGRISGVASCNLIDEGLDVPRVSCVIDLAPTASLSRFMQRVGRGLRPVYAPGHALDTAEARRAAMAAGEKPVLTVLDHAGNTLRHGMVDMLPIQPWSLEGRARRSGITPPSRQCPECFAIHSPRPTCPACGFDYDAAKAAAERRQIEQRAGELALMSAADRRIAMLRESSLDELVSDADTYDAMDEIRSARGYHPGWTLKMMSFRKGGRRDQQRTAGEEFNGR